MSGIRVNRRVLGRGEAEARSGGDWQDYSCQMPFTNVS